jgi:hypothetical protein
MRALPLFLILFALLHQAHAGPDFNCMKDCSRQGFDRNYCMGMCETRRDASGGLLDQPGLPRNPAFDQLKQDASPAQSPLPVIDQKCLRDCQRHGYNYVFCRKQCSYAY